MVDNIVRQVASGFPLIEPQTRDDGGDIRVWFRAPVYEERLTRQAFVLTLSSVLKAAATFDSITARRAPRSSRRCRSSTPRLNSGRKSNRS